MRNRGDAYTASKFELCGLAIVRLLISNELSKLRCFFLFLFYVKLCRAFATCETLVNLIFNSAAEVVGGNEVRLLVARLPNEVDLVPERRPNPAARVYVVHVGVDNNLQKHLQMVGTAAAHLVKPADAVDVKIVNYGVHRANGQTKDMPLSILSGKRTI